MQQRLRVAADSHPQGSDDGRRRHVLGQHDRHARRLFLAACCRIAWARSRRTPPGSFRANPQCPLTCASAITIMYVPDDDGADDDPRPTCRSHRPSSRWTTRPGCPEGDPLCGFKEGMRVLIIEPEAAPTTSSRSRTSRTTRCTCSTATTSSRLRIRPARGSRRSSRTPTTSKTTAPTRSSCVTTTATRPTCRSSTTSSISASSFSAIRRRRCWSSRSTDPQGPWTTYGPRPPALGQDNDDDPWPTSENCLFKVDGATGLQVPRPEIQTLGPPDGPPVLMPAGDAHRRPLVSGRQEHRAATICRTSTTPTCCACGKCASRCACRSSKALLRGPAGVLFRHAGTSQRRRALRAGSGNPVRCRAAGT